MQSPVSFAAVLAEAEVKRLEQEAHFETVRAARAAELKMLAEAMDTKGYRKAGSEAVHKHAPGQVQEILQEWHKEIAAMCQNLFTLAQMAKWVSEKAGFKIAPESVRDYCDRHGLRQKKAKSGVYLKMGQSHDQIVAWVAEGKTRLQISDLLGIPYRLVSDYIYTHQIGY